MKLLDGEVEHNSQVALTQLNSDVKHKYTVRMNLFMLHVQKLSYTHVPYWLTDHPGFSSYWPVPLTEHSTREDDNI